MIQPLIKDRVKNALWGLFIGDALAMPVHWFYSTERIRAHFPEGIDGYKAPPHPHPDSFMVGAGYHPDVEKARALGRRFDILHEAARYYRTSYGPFEYQLDSRETEHGNRTAAESQRLHYHHGLKAGDSTLGAHLVRVLMRSVIQSGGYSQSAFLQAFVDFLTTPSQHGDPYREIYLRRWFERYSRGVDPEDCADDQRQTWSIGSLGGMVRPLALSLLNWDNPLLAAGMALRHQHLTHKSELVSGALGLVTPVLLELLAGHEPVPRLRQLAGQLRMPAVTGAELFEQYRRHEGPGNIPADHMWRLHMAFQQAALDPDAATGLGNPCYIEHGLPLLVALGCRNGADFPQALQANAEEGGDCVHRGMVLGLLLGAASDQLPAALKQGLREYSALEKEITAFSEIAAQGTGHLKP